ncbi:MAG: 50S ribosomal protein L4 [Candidatus Woesearchaeota archaeon]|jgi:large subunit ribosomal protein L4e|nr:50S ribosomal protein L4 [Candidatus Woesearchaeota archaeon]MDP7324340.1 50S ribosomal protein L4 [Candidatus Woesearchaeota archaeon]MDP7457940.1 50S ribosomal protein L4 [Candidatus Woesearchaeota archaeon]
MKLSIINSENKKIADRELPKQFSEKIRSDLIKRAVLAIQANSRQSYGASPEAGKRHKGYVSKRRNTYRTTYGIGQSRTPRKVMSVRGSRFNWRGAVVPQAVGGRRAHPPKAEKNWDQKINKKERRKAIRSALAATLSKDLVGLKHRVPDQYPVIIDAQIESLSKTKDVITLLEKIGLKKELERCRIKTIRSGKGKMRGRKYQKKVGPLLVVSKECKLAKSAANVAGCDVTVVNNINTQLLAPGAIPGRLTIYTDKSLQVMEEKKLFM